DSFKAHAEPGVAIADSKSHASLARVFLGEFCADADLLAMVQNHDEPFALYRQFEKSGRYDSERFKSLLKAIKDWNLFLGFCIVDGWTKGKSREKLRWFFEEVGEKVQSKFSEADIAP